MKNIEAKNLPNGRTLTATTIIVIVRSLLLRYVKLRSVILGYVMLCLCYVLLMLRYATLHLVIFCVSLRYAYDVLLFLR